LDVMPILFIADFSATANASFDSMAAEISSSYMLGAMDVLFTLLKRGYFLTEQAQYLFPI